MASWIAAGRVRALSMACVLAGAAASTACTLTGDLCYLSAERCGEEAPSGGPGASSGGSSSTASGGGGPGAGAGGSGASGGGAPNGRRWPDSPTVFCSDGTTGVDPCPMPGDATHGQDGNYRLDVPAYPDTNALRVVDEVTGLIWQRDAQDEMTTADAIAACEALVLDGADDWRLPSVIELSSLVDYGRTTPTIDELAFPDAPGSCFKTSTKSILEGYSWEVCFGDGFSYVPPDDDISSVRCVRGSLPEPAWEVDGEVAFDPRTGLTWQRNGFYEDEAVANPTWLEALDYCREIAAANLGGHSDWRLPSVKELLTIADPTATTPAKVDGSVFDPRQGATHWSSTPRPDNPADGYVVYFGEGSVNSMPLTEHGPVRCVRGGSR